MLTASVARYPICQSSIPVSDPFGVRSWGAGSSASFNIRVCVDSDDFLYFQVLTYNLFVSHAGVIFIQCGVLRPGRSPVAAVRRHVVGRGGPRRLPRGLSGQGVPKRPALGHLFSRRLPERPHLRGLVDLHRRVLRRTDGLRQHHGHRRQEPAPGRASEPGRRRHGGERRWWLQRRPDRLPRAGLGHAAVGWQRLPRRAAHLRPAAELGGHGRHGHAHLPGQREPRPAGEAPPSRSPATIIVHTK